MCVKLNSKAKITNIVGANVTRQITRGETNRTAVLCQVELVTCLISSRYLD